MSAAWNDPLRMWLWLAVAQTTLCLGMGLLLGRKLSAYPARAHRRLVAAAGAALLTPLLAAVVGANRWGLLAAPANPVVYRSINPPAGQLQPPSESEVLARCMALVLAVLWAIPAVVLLARIVSAMRRGGWVAAALVALLLSGAVAVLQAHPTRSYGSRLFYAGVSSFVERFGR